MPAAEKRVARFAILGSGRGSNAVALMQAFRSGYLSTALATDLSAKLSTDLAAELAVVISNVRDAAILDHAVRFGYAAELIESRDLSRADHEERLLAKLRQQRVDHLLLAGYMRLLSPTFLSAWPGVILNIHPSLLPDFPGRFAVEEQWAAGVRIAGATVHFVDAGVDSGPILLGAAIDVADCESAAALAERIRCQVEHGLYPRAVRLLLERLARGVPLHPRHASPGAGKV